MIHGCMRDRVAGRSKERLHLNLQFISWESDLAIEAFGLTFVLSEDAMIGILKLQHVPPSAVVTNVCHFKHTRGEFSVSYHGTHVRYIMAWWNQYIMF